MMINMINSQVTYQLPSITTDLHLTLKYRTKTCEQANLNGFAHDVCGKKKHWDKNAKQIGIAFTNNFEKL